MRDVVRIETERLKLRPLAMSDAPAIAHYCSDPGVGRNLSMTPIPYFDVTAEGWILIVRARAGLGKEFVFGVELPGQGLIGAIGAHQRGGEGFEVGYWFGRPYWGLGYATEALAAFLAEARTLGDLHAGHFVDNPASGRVLTKGGFAYTGEVTPLFSMARGEKVACKRMRYAGADAARSAEQAACA
jgi:RimJ/RimL family protein N-acetyltransferase